MSEDYEARLAELPIAERRGVWTTWGADTWEAVLIKGELDAALDRLEAADGVGGVERDVTADVLAGKRPAPDGTWLLLVALADGTPWMHVAHGYRYFEQFENLATWLDVPAMRVGYQDTAGATHVTVREGGDDTLFFESTGMSGGGDDDFGGDKDFDDEEMDDPFDVPLRFETEMLPADWPKQFKREDEVQQALMRELDAYVPMIGAGVQDGNILLWAGHEDVLKKKNVKRIALVLLGEKRSSLPIDGNRQMAEAIEKGDVEGVRTAVETGASLTEVSGRKCSPLSFVVTAYRVEPDVRLAMADVLLEAGADPDVGGPGSDPPLIAAIDKASFETALALKLCKKLIDAGASLEVEGQGMLAKGQTPLYKAALTNKLGLVQFLHAHGADVNAKDSQGRTVREAMEQTHARMAEFMGEEDADEHIDAARPVLDYLARAEAGEPPSDDWQAQLDEEERAATRMKRELKASFGKLGEAFKELGKRMDEKDAAEGDEQDGSADAATEDVLLAGAAAAQPTIELEPHDGEWVNAKRQEQLGEAFADQGFTRIGTFKTTAGADVKVLAFVHQTDGLYGTVYEQRDGTSWCDVVRMHADDTVLTATNTASPAAYELDRFPKIRQPRWGVNKLVAAVRDAATTEGGVKAVSAERFLDDVKWVIAQEQAALRKQTGG